MKEATGEVSMTVVTIVVIALVLGIATWLFSGENSIGRQWINENFGNFGIGRGNITGSSGSNIIVNDGRGMIIH